MFAKFIFCVVYVVVYDKKHYICGVKCDTNIKNSTLICFLSVRNT